VSTADWELLEAHRHALTSYLRGKCPSEEDVEDCVQEAIMRVAQLRDVDARRLRGLLKTVAYNVAMDLHRDGRRQAAALARIGVDHPVAPDVVALDSWEARRLAEHARRLSFRERAALRGRIEGFAPHETAALIGDSPRSIHLALSRARTSLRRLAGAAILLVLWARRQGRRGTRLAAPSLVAMTVGLALLTPNLDVPRGVLPSPATPAPAVAQGALSAAPTVDPRAADLSSTSATAHASAGTTRPATSAGPGRETLVAAHADSPHLVEASAGVFQIDSNAPLLTRVGNCLKPGAISLSGHHLGCTG
jgi:RNA polymerase sigma factor (sigma-70 family)